MGDATKRQVTQEELDALYSSVPRPVPVKAPVSGVVSLHIEAETVAPASAVADISAYGVHLGSDRTVLIGVSKKGSVETEISLNVGYEKLEELVGELEKILVPKGRGRNKTPIYVTLTGKPAAFVLSRLPKMARPFLMKALRLQLKSVAGEDRENFQFLPLLSSQKLGETQTEYLAASVEKDLSEKLLGYLKKLKLKVAGWDLDIFCFTRAADFLWAKHGETDSTRFLVLLQWDHCFLLVAGPDGKLICPRLPIGIQSFLEHLLASRSAVLPKSLDEREWQVLPSDPIDVRQRKLLANQAIHEVYMPLAQQIKTQLYTGCNERGISLPTHFAVLCPGRQLFHVAETLSADLGLKLIPVEASVSAESVAALGAALWEREGARVNFVAKKHEMARQLKELWSSFKGKLGGTGEVAGLGALPPNFLVLAGVPLVIFIVLASFPLYSRWRVSRLLEARKELLQSLVTEKDRIKKAKERESAHDKRQGLAKMIEKRRTRASKGIQELFGILPQDIRLMSIAYKDNLLNLKGLSRNPMSLEKFLRDALQLNYLHEPTPLGIKRDKQGTEFEITFRFRPHS